MFSRISFALKLLLALVLTVLVAVGSVALLANWSASRNFDSYVSLGMRPRLLALVPLLENQYAATGNWDNARELLELGDRPGAGRGRGMMQGGPMASVLADADGIVIHGSDQQLVGQRLSRHTIEGAEPIHHGDDTVGYLMTNPGPQERIFDQRLGSSILVAGILASVVAILLGLMLIRAVARPLRSLRDAAQRIGAGDLSHRIPHSSHDEIGELAEQFNQMAEALERDEQLRQRMMADIAHELRTPLAVMQGQVEALLDGVFPLEVENILPIQEAVQLLSRLVSDLRDLALVDAGHLQLERGNVEAGQLVKRVVDRFRPMAAEQGLSLSLDAPSDEPTVYADAQRLEQVLGNLLSNALHYSARGGTVQIKLAHDTDTLHLMVEDSGPGIEEDDLPHIFERFYRSDKARSRASGGSGLGLSIAKQLVEAHGGEIRVESRLGVGTIFTVRLRLQSEAEV